MKSSLVIVSLLSTLFWGCSTSFQLSPVVQQSSSQKIIYQDGEEMAVSTVNETTIAAFGEKTERDEINLYILYLNNSSNSIDINPEQIEIIGYGINDKQFNLKVYSADEYIRKIKREQAWATFAKGLRAASDAYNASLYPSSTSNTTGYVGNIPFSATTNTYDATKQSEINRRNAKEIEQTVALNAFVTQSIRRELIKKNTLSPGQYVFGKLIAKYQQSNKFCVYIPFGSERHEILFISKE